MSEKVKRPVIRGGQASIFGWAGLIGCIAIAYQLLKANSLQVPLELQLYVQGYAKLLNASTQIHIFAGLLTIILGSLAISAKKGGQRHRLFGKIAVAMLVTIAISASMMLVLYCVIPTATDFARKDTLRLLSAFILVVTYCAAQGYRWSISAKPRLDTDILMAGLALVSAIYCFANIPLDVIFDPFKSANPVLPMRPLLAGFLLVTIGGLLLYFGIDDIKTYMRGKVSPQDRILKHVYRVMTAFGGAVTALFIFHVSSYLVAYKWPLGPVFILPPTLIGLGTMLLARRIKTTPIHTS